MQKSNCPVCGYNEQKIIYKDKFPKRNLLRCKSCASCYLWPRATLGRDEEIYTAKYYNAWSFNELGQDGLAKMKHATFGRLLDVISKYKSSGCLLDIGCAFGHLLEVAKIRGWDTYGVEISEYAAGEAKANFGNEKIFVGNFLDLSLPRESFDVITMVDIIEHIYDISGVLIKCSELLKKHGLLIMVTPDIDSLSHTLIGRFWPNFNEQHVVFLSRINLKNILNKYGFRLLEKTSYKKALNFYYLQSVMDAHSNKSSKFFVTLIKIINMILTSNFKKLNLFMPQGEMLVISEKN